MNNSPTATLVRPGRSTNVKFTTAEVQQSWNISDSSRRRRNITNHLEQLDCSEGKIFWGSVTRLETLDCLKQKNLA